MVNLIARRADVADTLVLVLRATGTTEDLEDVEDREVDESTLARVVHLRALDDNCVRREIDTPGERGRAAQDLQVGNDQDRHRRREWGMRCTLVTLFSNIRSEMLRSERSMPAW